MDISYRYIVNAKRAAVWNYQFLASGLSSFSIFGSWFMVFLNFWLVVIPVERFLACGCRGNQCGEATVNKMLG